MPTYTWPHAHLSHALADYLKLATSAQGRVTTEIPRTRTYPLLVAQEAGLGRLGTDAAIQADEVRLQVDAWAQTKLAAVALAAQVFRLLDARFSGALKNTTLLTEDEAAAGEFYQTKVERIARSGGGDPFFDEYAHVWRVPAFYNVKVNL